MLNLTLVSDRSRDVAMATDFAGESTKVSISDQLSLNILDGSSPHYLASVCLPVSSVCPLAYLKNHIPSFMKFSVHAIYAVSRSSSGGVAVCFDRIFS